MEKVYSNPGEAPSLGISDVMAFLQEAREEQLKTLSSIMEGIQLLQAQVASVGGVANTADKQAREVVGRVEELEVQLSRVMGGHVSGAGVRATVGAGDSPMAPRSVRLGVAHGGSGGMGAPVSTCSTAPPDIPVFVSRSQPPPAANPHFFSGKGPGNRSTTSTSTTTRSNITTAPAPPRGAQAQSQGWSAKQGLGQGQMQGQGERLGDIEKLGPEEARKEANRRAFIMERKQMQLKLAVRQEEQAALQQAEQARKAKAKEDRRVQEEAERLRVEELNRLQEEARLKKEREAQQQQREEEERQLREAKERRMKEAERRKAEEARRAKARSIMSTLVDKPLTTAGNEETGATSGGEGTGIFGNLGASKPAGDSLFADDIGGVVDTVEDTIPGSSMPSTCGTRVGASLGASGSLFADDLEEGSVAERQGGGGQKGGRGLLFDDNDFAVGTGKGVIAVGREQGGKEATLNKLDHVSDHLDGGVGDRHAAVEEAG
ncbi:unnamed protein product, partial [Discosporangium mesarthrocarpum]